MNYKINIKAVGVAFALVVLAFLYGNRVFGYEKDFYYYNLIYEQIVDNLEDLFSRYEPGFLLVNLLSKCIGLSFYVYSTLVIGLALCIKAYLISRGRFFLLPLLVYVIWLSWLHEGTQIRAAISVAFFYLSIYLLYKESKVKSVISFLMAASMHVTPLLYLPVYLIAIIKKGSLPTKKSMIVFSVCCIFFAWVLVQSVANLHPNYDGYVGIGSDFSFLSLKMLPMYTILLLCNPDRNKSNQFKFLYFVAIYSIALSVALYELGSVPVRVLEYSFFAYLLMCNDKSVPKKKSLLLISLLLLIAIVGSIKFLYFDGDYFVDDM